MAILLVGDGDGGEDEEARVGIPKILWLKKGEMRAVGDEH